MRAALALLVLATTTLAAPALAQTTFSDALDDVPLADGLTEDPAARLVFADPGGRIIHTAAEGVGAAAGVVRYYEMALPALGWQKAGPGLRFTRGGEILEITVLERDGRVRALLRVFSPGPPLRLD